MRININKERLRKFLVTQSKIRAKILIPGLLILIFTFALFLRTYYPYDEVFQEPIKYAADDGVYHMRLVENMLLGGHFPNRIYFDPYSYFPYGTHIHFGPLYDQLLAGFILLFSGFKPTLEAINSIAPYFPAVLGSLTIFLLYFLGKKLWSKWAGIIAAFLIAVVQPFLFRSLLGATDHHQAEVFFSTLAILCFVCLADFVKKKGSDINVLIKDKKFWGYNILLGFLLGLYFLIWNGAVLFLFIIAALIGIYYIFQYVLKNKKEDWLLISGSVFFLIALIMISPHFSHPDIFWAAIYDIRHLAALLLGILGFGIIGGIARLFKKFKIHRYAFPLALLFFGLVFLAILKLSLPIVYNGLLSLAAGTKVGMVRNEFAREVVGEMSPLGMAGAFNSFFYLFYISLLALAVILYRFIKGRDIKDLLILIWTIVILLVAGVIIPATGQNRFSYYLAINVSLLCGFLAWWGIKTALSSFRISARIKEASFFLKIGGVLLLANLIFFIFYPFPLNLFDRFPDNLPAIFQSALGTAESGAIGRNNDLYETLDWVRENTPEVGLDYYDYYQEPKYNPETKRIDPYPYSDGAYGIMASWDMGHMITYYAHRIPNANPFQQGVSEPGKPGEVDFFLSLNEARAAAILDLLKTKYIITDDGSCNAYAGFRSKAIWTNQIDDFYFTAGASAGKAKSLYDQTICARLEYLDGRGYEGGQNKTIPLLTHFRLVYESDTKVRDSRLQEEKNGGVKMVKVFEYVPGAVISGRAADEAKVVISTEIKTNQNRIFTYSQETLAEDGKYEFVVPYSTEGKDGWQEGGTKYSVFADDYIIKIGKYVEKKVKVKEGDIIGGKTIIVQ
ncbi:oligosaccharyl transferase, archaeosortase A system-associated [Patescibacteria group bacterium]|nr:oligosaccharyl transferase, archaeosortase A system-associated [Patescibacteria group bacterium]